MRYRNRFAVRQKLSTRTYVAVAGALLLAGGIVFLLNMAHTEETFAATCSSSYSVDWNNPATYTVNCGSVNSASWTVKMDSCWYTSPTLLVGGVAGDPNKSVDLSVRINQSGNLTNNDYCWIYFYVNGAVQSSWIGRGDTVTSGVFYVPVTLSVPAGGNYRIAVHLMTDKNNEFWEVKKGDIISCVVSTGSPLPVDLTAFSAAMTESGAKISWTTAAEVNNDHFTVSRSDNGQDFTDLARIPGSGTTSLRHEYTFTDTEIPAGLSYYRLSQSDYDGTTKTYGPITLHNRHEREFQAKAFPNPFDSDLNYSFNSGYDGTGEIVITDLRGALIEKFPVEFNKGVNSIRLTPSKLAPGYYTIGLRAGDGQSGVVKICRK